MARTGRIEIHVERAICLIASRGFFTRRRAKGRRSKKRFAITFFFFFLLHLFTKLMGRRGGGKSEFGSEIEAGKDLNMLAAEKRPSDMSIGSHVSHCSRWSSKSDPDFSISHLTL